MPYTIPSSVISPGPVYQPRKSKLILDQITGAIAAWSTRRLISSAPADIARGRDASTNEQDFTAAELAGSGFTDLAGAGDGFYVTLYDQIGSNNATQSTAASQPKGVSSGALITDGDIPVLDFDGSSDGLIVSDNAAFNWSTALTVSFWVKFTSASSGVNEGVLSKWDNTNKEFLIIRSAANQFQFRVSGDGSTVISSTLTSNPTFTDFFHLSIVYNGASVAFYINGVSSASTDSGSIPTSIFNGPNNIAIGGSLSGGSLATLFGGRLYDVIIFNRALSADEISQLYAALI